MEFFQVNSPNQARHTAHYVRWTLVRISYIALTFIGVIFHPIEDVAHSNTHWIDLSIFLIIPALFSVALFILCIIFKAKLSWHAPSWGDSLFGQNWSAQFFHLGAYSMLAASAGSVINAIVLFKAITPFNLLPATVGLSILLALNIVSRVYRWQSAKGL